MAASQYPIQESTASIASKDPWKKQERIITDSPNVMISYQWDAQERMLTLKDELVKAGYNVWMDVEKMVGNLDDRMADAIEKAAVVVICFSEKYHHSQSCKAEAQYAKSLKKTIVPLRYQNFKASGWLGLMVNPLLYYKVETHVDLKSNLPKILEAVERGVKDHREKEPLRVALLGMTGTGKSATGNSILACTTKKIQSVKNAIGMMGNAIGDAINWYPFKQKISPQSVTKNCKREDAVVLGRPISIVDTPGFFDTRVSLEMTVQEITKCILLVAPGPHAILTIIHVTRFTPEVTAAIEQMRLMLGKDSTRFIILVFTGVDGLVRDGGTLEEYVDELTGTSRQLVEDCNHRYIGFNNTFDKASEGNKTQVEKLLRMAEKIKQDNGGQCYTNEHLRLAEKVVQEQIKKRQAIIDKSEKEKLEQLQKIAYLKKDIQLAAQDQAQLVNAIAKSNEKIAHQAKHAKEREDQAKAREAEAKKREAEAYWKMAELQKNFLRQCDILKEQNDDAIAAAAKSKEAAIIEKELRDKIKALTTPSNSTNVTPSSTNVNPSSTNQKKSCFAADSIVRLLDSKGQVHATRLSDLKIGDLVESYDPDKNTIAFSEVYYITYQDEFGTSSTLRQLWYDDIDVNHSRRSIRLHADHLIYATKGEQGSAVGPPATPVMSKEVAVGDLIWVKSNGDSLVPVPVKKIEEVVVNVRHPMTLSHYIIVDDVLASVHMNNEWLLRRVTWPLRYLYGWSPSLNEGWFTKRCVQSWDWVEDHMLV